MDNLIPIEKVLETNLRVQELEKEGFIITPNNIDAYLESFKIRKSAEPSEKYWNEKRVLITGIGGMAKAAPTVFGDFNFVIQPLSLAKENIEEVSGELFSSIKNSIISLMSQQGESP